MRLEARIQDKRRLLAATKARLASLRCSKAQGISYNGHSGSPPTPDHTPHGTTAAREAGLTRSQFFRDPPSMEASSAEHAQHADHAHTYPHVTANSLPFAAPTRPSTHLVHRHAAPTLHHAASTLPPPLSSFRAFAGISYADLKECSGSAGRSIDFTHANLPDLIRRVRAEKAAREGCGVGEVCFFLQLHWDAAPGLPLSMSSTQSTTECVASAALGYLAADLEALLRACRCGAIGAALGITVQPPP